MRVTTHQLAWQTHRLELGSKTRIMGILNVTPDSFSDGGRFFAHETALAHAEKMIADGADIIDIGGESTRPFSEPVSAEEECRRVLPVIEQLAGRLEVPISIDTTKAKVAQKAISAGASIINDISALRFDPEMGRVAAETDALTVLMHMKGSPADMQVAPTYEDLIGEIYQFLKEAILRAQSYGIDKSKLIIDPGIGFGKTAAHNLCLIQELDAFQELGVPVLLGSSRKAFIRKILGAANGGGEPPPTAPEIETGTQASITAGVLNGAHMVRVHEVGNASATIKIADAIKNACLSAGAC
ncbi:MAG: dihydropteroate synthase [Desulfobacterales bacterium]|nr:dihydropteroate synthase [Desulfobacterales bacterium]